MPLDPKAVIAEMDSVLAGYAAMRRSSKHSDCSDHDDVNIAAMIVTLAAAIERFAPPASPYRDLQDTTLKKWGPEHSHALAPLAGILTALRTDVAAGRLASVVELLHADLFGDFLDMAQHLLDEGYKDPAAVLAGGVLEEHLRKLCGKHSLSVVSAPRPVKADTMNAELASVSAYSKSDQKSVTAWLGLRNDAAHGKYGAYAPEQVAILIHAVRDFITRIPA